MAINLVFFIRAKEFFLPSIYGRNMTQWNETQTVQSLYSSRCIISSLFCSTQQKEKNSWGLLKPHDMTIIAIFRPVELQRKKIRSVQRSKKCKPPNRITLQISVACSKYVSDICSSASRLNPHTHTHTHQTSVTTHTCLPNSVSCRLFYTIFMETFAQGVLIMLTDLCFCCTPMILGETIFCIGVNL